MNSFTVGTVYEREDETRSLYDSARSVVSIADRGVELQVSSGVMSAAWTTLTPDKARELGFLLIKAADRHGELVKQVALIEEQRKTLSDKQNSLIQELLK